MTDTAVWVGAIGAVVGGLGAATGAIFSWRSASASRETSRDALEALALAMVPSVYVRTTLEHPLGGLSDTFTYFLEVTNGTGWEATDVVVEVRYRGGRTARFDRERLPPPPMNWQVARRRRAEERGEPPWRIPIEGVAAGGQGLWGNLEEHVERVVVAYSDLRGIARYEMTILPTTPGLSSPGSPIESEKGQVRRLR